MNREKIMPNIEALQNEADEQGFKGQNEYDLFLRESIADYIERLMAEKNKYNNTKFDITPKIKGCLSGKTEKMKQDYFEILYAFKNEDPIFFIEQTHDLLNDELEQFATWIFENKYKGIIENGSIISSIDYDKEYHITLIARLNSELIENNIITPMQKKQIENYILNNIKKK